MIYKLTQIHYQMQAPTGRHNSILNCRVNSYIIAFFEKNEHKIAFFLAYVKKMQYLCGGFV